jgi:hypothetical protein
VVDGAAGYHEAGVEGAAGDPSERVPCPCTIILLMSHSCLCGGCR